MSPRPLRLDPNRFSRLRKRPLVLADVEVVAAEAKDAAVAAAAEHASGQASSVLWAAATDAQAKATAAKDAVLASIPEFATTDPMPEDTTPTVGSISKIARPDHRHPRLTSTTGPHTLDANGRVVVNFTRSFPGPNPPGLSVMRVVDTDVQERPVEFQATYVMVLGSYTGAIIRGRRASVLPTLTPVSVGALLTGVLTGVNSVVTSLTGFDVFGAPAVGVKFTCIAVKSSA